MSLILCSEAQAKDLGVVGQTFPVVEPDLLAVIHQRLEAMEKSGAIARQQEELKRRTLAFVERPSPVPGIGRTVRAATWLYDPTVTLDMDLRGVDGQVFHHKGERINPLDYRPFTRTLIFVDGDDPKQMEWALALDRRKGGATKIIFVKGAVIDWQKRLKRPLYFDQHGVLVRKFGIAHVPATVAQEGRMLRVSEVTP